MPGMCGHSTLRHRICVVEQCLRRAVCPEYLLGRWANGIDRTRQKKLSVMISGVHDLRKVVFLLRIEMRTDRLSRKNAIEQLCQGHNARIRVK